VVVVDDGSAAEEDVVLREIAADRRVTILTKANAGLGAARNSGIAVSSGPYVVPLDADNRLAPTFVERCLEVLERRPDLEYVTTWSRYVEEDGTPFPDDGTGGWQPLTNDTAFLDRRNVAGDAVALFRRRVFDDGLLYDPELTSYEDWYLYLRMRDRGRFGLTIPERLFDYRVRASSMLRAVDDRADRRLLDEMRARRREQEVEWCPWNA
jgi:glycosyltransferase involved in cell wall biosynthesis